MANRFLSFIMVLLLSIPGIVPLRAQQASSLIAQYLFNGSLDDASGNGNVGMQYGGVDYAEDRFGNPCGAMGFDGNGYISVPHSPSLNFSGNEVTISTWFYLDQGATDLKWLTVVCKSDVSQETPMSPHFRLQATRVTLSLNTEFTENLDQNVQLGRWYHYTMVYDGREVIAYLDGVPFFSYPYYGQLNQNSMPLEIGRDLPGNVEYFAGRLDDLRIYSRSLSAREIRRIYEDKSEKNAPRPCVSNPVVSTPPPSSPASTPTPPPVQVAAPAPTPIPPIVTVVAPVQSPTQATNPRYKIRAQIEHVGSKQDVEFTVGGKATRDFNFDASSGLFTAEVPLEAGYNIYSITGKNQFGRDNQMVALEYVAPTPTPTPATPPPVAVAPPTVAVSIPTANPAEVTRSDQTITAITTNVSKRDELEVRFNGRPRTAFRFDPANGELNFSVNLNPGLNTYEIIATTPGGRDAKSGVITLLPPRPLPPPLPTDAGEISVKDSIVVNVPIVNLVIYDHEKQDGDVVSVYCNDNRLVNKQELKINPKEWIRVSTPVLTEGQDNLIIAKAWNLGKVPPNTMTIEVRDGDTLLDKFILESEIGFSQALKITYRP